MNDAVRKKKNTGTIFSDMELFIKACEEIEDPNEVKSIAEVANKIGLSPTGLISCFRRLADVYDCELIESRENIAGFTLTEAGNDVLKGSINLFKEFQSIKSEVARKAKDNKDTTVVRICTSPYLLAHAFPNAVSTLKDETTSSIIKIECTEGYDTDKVIEEILSGNVEIAVLWHYPEKIRKANLTKGISCVVASTKIEAVFVFGKNHEKFIEWERTGEQPTAFIDEMDGETLFLLERDHQPFYDLIPRPDLTKNGKRVEFTTIMSIIGSIRAGMNGTAIIPAIYKDIDRYRSDGSLYCIPIERTRNSRDKDKDKDGAGDGNKLFLRIIYMYKGSKLQMRQRDPHDGLPKFSKPGGSKDLYGWLNSSVQRVLEHIDDIVLKTLGIASGWEKGFQTKIELSPKEIKTFTKSLHISPTKIGFSEPRWKLSTIVFDDYNSPEHLKSEAAPLSSSFNNSKYLGKMVTGIENPHESRQYSFEAEIIDDAFLCMRGSISAKSDSDVDDQRKLDSFVAILGFQSSDRNYLLGVVSGQDDSGSSPITTTFLLIKEHVDIDNIKEQESIAYYLQMMNNRTLVRTDIRSHRVTRIKQTD